MTERVHPYELSKPTFDLPVVCSVREQMIGIAIRVVAASHESARIGPEVLDFVLGKPPLHFAQRVPMLLGMLILIAQPRLVTPGLVLAISQDGVERNHPISREPGDEPSQPQREARDCVVQADDDQASRPGQPYETGEPRTRAWQVMEHAGRIHDVEHTCPQPWRQQVRLHELHAIDPEPTGRIRREPQRLTSQVGRDDEALATRQIQAHLTGATTDFDDAGISGNCPIELPGEIAALGPRAQPHERVARRISGKRRPLIEAPDHLDAHVARKTEVGNAVRRVVLPATTGTRPVGAQFTFARRAGEEAVEPGHHSHQIE